MHWRPGGVWGPPRHLCTEEKGAGKGAFWGQGQKQWSMPLFLILLPLRTCSERGPNTRSGQQDSSQLQEGV